MSDMSLPAPRPQSSRRKKFACSHCAREFSRAEHLERHIRSHTKEKPFQCPDCGNRYSRFDVLARHRRNASNHTVGASINRQGSAQPQETISCSFRHHRDVPDVNSSPPGRVVGQEYSNVMSGEANASLLIPEQFPVNYQPSVNDCSAPIGSDREQHPASINVEVPQQNWDFQDGLFLPQFFDLNEPTQSWTVNETIHANIFDLSPVATPMVNTVPIPPTQNDNFGADKVKQTWFTRESNAALGPEFPSGYTSGMLSPQPSSDEVNDHGRSRLQRRLQIYPFESHVPSTEFLNTCIRLYFSKAHSLFPVIHPATFRPSKANTPVTLGICVIGCLFMGSKEALDIGMHLFERLNKATLLYWEKAKAKDPDELIAIIQGAVMGQLFALLSGIPNMLLIADAFHGPPVAWARQQRLCSMQRLLNLGVDLPEDELEQAWREWAKNEGYIRTTYALRILDAELASLLHHEPIMRLNCRSLPYTSSDKLFMARKVEDWKSQYLAESKTWSVRGTDSTAPNSVFPLDISKIPLQSAFTAYAILEELHTRVFMMKAENCMTKSTMQDVHSQLCAFLHHFLSPKVCKESNVLVLSVLWHSVYISMSADLDLLERAVGREGSQVTAEERAQVMNWAAADDAQRAIAHALLIKKRVESMTLLHEPAIHVPRALFNASIVLFCYSKFASQQQRGKLTIPDDIVPEIKMAGESATSLLLESRERAQGVLMFQKALYTMVQLLQRLGSWGISRRFALIIGTIIGDELGRA